MGVVIPGEGLFQPYAPASKPTALQGRNQLGIRVGIFLSGAAPYQTPYRNNLFDRNRDLTPSDGNR